MWQSLKNKYHLVVALLANIRYGFPSRRITVIGITGTDGKTTTSSLVHHLLQQAGKKASVVTTVYAKIGGTEYDTGFHVSTPHSMTVQRFLRQSVDNGDEYFVMETTSHALDQNRVFGVRFAVGLITNISHEHLDYHKTYERYVAAKCTLLRQARHRFANCEDQSYSLITQQVPDLTSFGVAKGDVHEDLSQTLKIELPAFQKANYVAAMAIALQLGLSRDEIIAGLASFSYPPGRYEIVATEPVTAIVDFAHTPHSLKQILSAVRSQFLSTGTGRLIHVFGCAAERDESKRPLMGVESGVYADTVILTEEDHRFEDPEEINAQIGRGLEDQGYTKVQPDQYTGESKTFTSIVDRQTAIRTALAISEQGDVVIATGKGHEKSLCRGAVEEPWSDRSAIEEAIHQRYGS